MYCISWSLRYTSKIFRKTVNFDSVYKPSPGNYVPRCKVLSVCIYAHLNQVLNASLLGVGFLSPCLPFYLGSPFLQIRLIGFSCTVTDSIGSTSMLQFEFFFIPCTLYTLYFASIEKRKENFYLSTTFSWIASSGYLWIYNQNNRVTQVRLAFLSHNFFFWILFVQAEPVLQPSLKKLRQWSCLTWCILLVEPRVPWNVLWWHAVEDYVITFASC